MDLEVRINGNVMDEDYPIPEMKTIFHNLHGASYFGKKSLIRCILSNLAGGRCKRNIHNQHIARIVKDVQASSGPKELFINLSKMY